MRSPLIVCLFAALAGIPVAAPAGPVDVNRRDRLEPELIIESGGRMGYCDYFTFTDDGKQLLAVGDDKVVRVWDFVEGKLRHADTAVLRWSIWREQRGSIYALALSPDEKNQYVAIGGLGALNTTVTVLDRTTGEVVHSVTPVVKGKNFYAVWSVTFSPSGKKVAFGTGDGSVFVWDFKSWKCCGQHKPRPEQKGYNKVHLVRFLDEGDDTLLSVAADGSVCRWDVGGDAIRQIDSSALTEKKQTLSQVITLSRDEKWLVGAIKGPRVVVRSLDGKQQRDFDLKEGEFARGLAFDPRNPDRLAVGVGSLIKAEKGPQFHVEADDAIRLYDLKKGTFVEGPPHTNRAEFLAFHPKLNYLAVAGGDNHEVTLWDLAKPKVPAAVMRGVGSCLWGVAVSENGEQVGFKDQRDAQSPDPNRRGKGDWRVFDLPRRKWVEAADFDPVKQLDTADGWTVEPDATNPKKLYAVKGKKFELPRFPDQEDIPRCFRFIPADGKTPTRLAVGHYWGLSLYELTDKGPRRTRVYAGHQGEVMSLAVSADHTWIVSASPDQTLAGWNLGDVFPSQPILGTKFAIEGDRLLVKKVDVGSPAWEAGLVENDEVIRFVFTTDETSEIFETDKSSADRKAALQRLENPEPGREHYFLVRRGGQTLPLTTTARHRPLWRFFPTRDGEWALWMWRNSFYDCSTKGDSYIGWHVNAPALDGTPKFYPAERFRKVLERPDVIDMLLKERSVAAATKVARKDQQPLSFDRFEPPAVTLQVDPGEVTDKQDVKVTLTATALRTNPDYQPKRGELWVNDYRLAVWDDLKDWKVEDGQYRLVYVIPSTKLSAGDNVITFLMFNGEGGRAEISGSVQCQRRLGQRRLFGAVVGVNDYSNAKAGNVRGNLQDLRGAKNDAKELDALWAQQDKLYAGKPDVFLGLDKTGARKEVLKALDDLAEKVGPDDNCVIFLAGHGLFVDPVVKGVKRSTFVFCGPDFDLEKPLETGISSELLFAKLAAIQGHKVVILDACHSGAATLNPVRGLVPSGQGPVVMAACDRGQFSFEFPKDDQEKREHGLFTYAILQALGDKFKEADTNKNGELDATELFMYTRRALPDLLTEIKQKQNAQVPIMFIPARPLVPLAKAKEK